VALLTLAARVACHGRSAYLQAPFAGVDAGLTACTVSVRLSAASLGHFQLPPSVGCTCCPTSRSPPPPPHPTPNTCTPSTPYMPRAHHLHPHPTPCTCAPITPTRLTLTICTLTLRPAPTLLSQEPLTEFRFGDIKVLDTKTWAWSDMAVRAGVCIGGVREVQEARKAPPMVSAPAAMHQARESVRKGGGACNVHAACTCVPPSIPTHRIHTRALPSIHPMLLLAWPAGARADTPAPPLPCCGDASWAMPGGVRMFAFVRAPPLPCCGDASCAS